MSVCLVTECDTVDVLFKLITLDMLLFFMIMRRKQLHMTSLIVPT